jgi:hypothetical protein
MAGLIAIGKTIARAVSQYYEGKSDSEPYCGWAPVGRRTDATIRAQTSRSVRNVDPLCVILLGMKSKPSFRSICRIGGTMVRPIRQG